MKKIAFLLISIAVVITLVSYNNFPEIIDEEEEKITAQSSSPEAEPIPTPIPPTPAPVTPAPPASTPLPEITDDILTDDADKPPTAKQIAEELFNAHLVEFDLTFEYQSSHFIFYSTQSNSQFMSFLAENLEERMTDIFILFNLNEQSIIPILYYDYYDYHAAYPWREKISSAYNPGHTEKNKVLIRSEYNNAAPDGDMINLLVHEAVHALQYQLLGHYRIPAWLGEGTATYFMTNRFTVINLVRQNKIPTFEFLRNNDDFMVDGGWENYMWAATIIDFISETWGFENVIKLHYIPDSIPLIFKISLEEFENQWHQFLQNNYS